VKTNTSVSSQKGTKLQHREQHLFFILMPALKTTAESESSLQKMIFWLSKY